MDGISSNGSAASDGSVVEVEDKNQKLSATSRVTKEVGFGSNKKPSSEVAKDAVDNNTSDIVPFTYRNFSQIVSKTPFSVLLNNHNKSLSFPLKLHVVLSREESKDVIEWLPVSLSHVSGSFCHYMYMYLWSCSDFTSSLLWLIINFMSVYGVAVMAS